MEIVCHFREIWKKEFLQPSKAKWKLKICYNKAMENKKKLLLIDGSSVAYRAFFALYNQIDRFKNRAGLHTNAIYGFTSCSIIY